MFYGYGLFYLSMDIFQNTFHFEIIFHPLWCLYFFEVYFPNFFLSLIRISSNCCYHCCLLFFHFENEEFKSWAWLLSWWAVFESSSSGSETTLYITHCRFPLRIFRDKSSSSRNQVVWAGAWKWDWEFQYETMETHLIPRSLCGEGYLPGCNSCRRKSGSNSSLWSLSTYSSSALSPTLTFHGTLCPILKLDRVLRSVCFASSWFTS